MFDSDDLSHSAYPHEPGYLYDCPACEAECFCTRIPGSTEYAECVFCESLGEEFCGTWASVSEREDDES